MNTVTRHSDNCTVKQAATGREVDGVIMAFNEGRAAGMDFISDGPTISKTKTSSRG